MMTATVRLALILVGTAAYLGLAVLGRGGPAAFFSEPALVALTITIVALAVASFFAGGNLSSGVREDRGNRWVLAGFAVIGVLDGYLPAYTDRKELWTFDGDAIRWLGVALFAAGRTAPGPGGWFPGSSRAHSTPPPMRLDLIAAPVLPRCYLSQRRIDRLFEYLDPATVRGAFT